MQISKRKQGRGLAWLSAVLAIIIMATLALQLSVPARSTDLWWHMALGRHILDSGSLIIDHAQFSWTPATSYHVYNSWLTDIILYRVNEWLGTGGLIALRFLVYFGIVMLAWRHAARLGIAGNPLSWLIILISLTVIWVANEIKPELFSLGFMSIVVWLYYHMRTQGNQAWRLPYLYPFLLVLWINMHGAFFIASLFFACVVAGELLNARFSPDQAMPKKLRKHFLIALGLCIPALLLNPFTYELPLEIMGTLLENDIAGYSRISAYLPTFIFNFPPNYMLDYLIAAMVLFVFLLWQKLKLRQTDWVVILSFVAYCILFIQMGRTTAYLAPVFLFAALDLLAEKERSWAWPVSLSGQILLAGVCLILILVISGRAVLPRKCDLLYPQNRLARILDPSTQTVSESADFIKENLSGKKIGNVYEAGGYLLYRFWPEKKVMIDPRAFPFKAWIDSYFSFGDGSNMDEFVANNAADFWLIDFARMRTFEWFVHSEDWALAFLGPNSGVFVPAAEAPAEPRISEKIDKLNHWGDISVPLAIAFKHEYLAFARRLHQAALKNPGTTCRDHKTLAEEISNAIIGLEFYNNAQYTEAAQIFTKPGKYIHTHGKAARALMNLAENNWGLGDFVEARKNYVEIFNVLPENALLVTDIYNFALLDWHYRHSDKPGLEAPTDDYHWENLVKFILANEEKLPEERRFIAEMAIAMNTGAYDGTARLVQRKTELTSVNK